MKPVITVVIPVYNAAATLGRTLESLRGQRFGDFEVLLVDDGSNDAGLEGAGALSDQRIQVLRTPGRSGPAAARNIGIKRAAGEIIAFTDSDVVLPPEWLERIDAAFKDREVAVIVGNVVAPPSTVLGNAIAAQGFPGGGSIGFDRMWKVSPDGCTTNITSCNFAARRRVFEEHGSFDESFPLAGGEDTELAFRLVKNGVMIRYVPEVVVEHEPRTGLAEWVRWQVLRGRACRHFKLKVGNVSGYVGLRVWSSWNVVKASFPRPRFPLVVLLLLTSFFLQQWGYLFEAIPGRHSESHT